MHAARNNESGVSTAFMEAMPAPPEELLRSSSEAPGLHGLEAFGSLTTPRSNWPVSVVGPDLLLERLYNLLQCLFSCRSLQQLAIPCLEALEANTRECVCDDFLPYLSPTNSAAAGSPRGPGDGDARGASINSPSVAAHDSKECLVCQPEEAAPNLSDTELNGLELQQKALAEADRQQTRTYSVRDAVSRDPGSPINSPPHDAVIPFEQAHGTQNDANERGNTESIQHDFRGSSTKGGSRRRVGRFVSSPLFRPPLLRPLRGLRNLNEVLLAAGEWREDTFTELLLVKAFRRLDAQYRITARNFVTPSKNECKNILNLAQIFATRRQLRLLTLDGDETLYPDGANFHDPQMGSMIAQLLRKGVYVAVVTGAGYGYEVDKYSIRLGFLFEIFAREKLPLKAARRFFLMAGESNYLLRLSASFVLEPVPEHLWRRYRPPVAAADCAALLNVAERSLVNLSIELKLDGTVIRKQRAVGLVPKENAVNSFIFGCVDNRGMHKESLQEAVMRVRRDIVSVFGTSWRVPYSVFTGGCDIWVDVGNKAEGVAMLQGLLGLRPRECLHVGDQFDIAGNDLAARICAPTLCINNPGETAAVLMELLQEDSDVE